MSDDYQWDKGQLGQLKFNTRKKKSIRIFIQRKRLSSGKFLKSTLAKSNSIERLTSIIEKKLNRKKKNQNIIVVNYKPVFVRSPEQKPSSSPPPPPISTKTEPQKPIPLDMPDVEDPLMFIEMMYQQLFTEDGQLRSGTEPTAFANRVKQIVTQSRRNSMVHRESLSTSNLYLNKLSASPRFRGQTLSEDEESQTLLTKSRTTDASRRSSKKSSMDHGDQHLNTFLNAYRHHQKRRSTTYSIYNSHTPYSIDDTDNEDLDTFSDINSYRKLIRHSPPASIDEDTLPTDSKLLSSSGYHSLKSPTDDSKKPIETNALCCPNCVPSSSSSSISVIQPIREMLVKYLNFVLISKNILLVPLLIFLLRQRSMNIGN